MAAEADLTRGTLGEVVAQAPNDGEEDGRPSRPVLLVALPEILTVVEAEAHELGPHRVNGCLESVLANRYDGRHRFPPNVVCVPGGCLAKTLSALCVYSQKTHMSHLAARSFRHIQPEEAKVHQAFPKVPRLLTNSHSDKGMGRIRPRGVIPGVRSRHVSIPRRVRLTPLRCMLVFVRRT